MLLSLKVAGPRFELGVSGCLNATHLVYGVHETSGIDQAILPRYVIQTRPGVKTLGVTVVTLRCGRQR